MMPLVHMIVLASGVVLSSSTLYTFPSLSFFSFLKKVVDPFHHPLSMFWLRKSIENRHVVVKHKID
jgi:hypothetical protein